MSEADTEEKTEFTFAELSDKAKEKARDAIRYHPVEDEWWTYVYEDAVRMGALMGFEIGNKTVSRTVRGIPIECPDIWFSGFCSQGDGCCWTGWIVVDALSGAVERIRGETSDEALWGLAARCEELFGTVAAIAVKNRLTPEDVDQDWPEVSLTMRINVEGKECYYCTRVMPGTDLPDEMEKFADGLVDDFASWIYDQLEAEHDYLTSDEQLDEQLAGMSFDEGGNML